MELTRRIDSIQESINHIFDVMTFNNERCKLTIEYGDHGRKDTTILVYEEHRDWHHNVSGELVKKNRKVKIEAI